jgi:glyoxylase-like metal-dependent hydrolase (beta-lactamase superfamily II)
MLLENLQRQGEMFGVRGLRNVLPDRWLKEGDKLSVGPHEFQILHCPGHTPGHVVFVNHAVKFAQVGDVLFQGSVGRTDFPYGDHAALINAIKTKLLPLGDDYNFICGHGPNSTFGAERKSNPFIQ